MAQAQVVTAEQLFAMPRRPRYELWYGELRPVSQPGAQHGSIAVRFGARLLSFVEEHDLGTAFVEAGFILARGPDLVLGPDASFVRKERLSAGIPQRYIEGAPCLVVEVVSPNDTYASVHRKAEEYLSHGARIVVVVEPERRRVLVHRSETEIEVLTDQGTFEAGDVVPGFRLEIADLFRGM